MTTSDAGKRIRENAAQAATTPAPVAVPEGGWRDGDWIVAIDGSDRRVAARGNGFWEWQSDTGGPLAIGMDSRVEEMVCAGRVIHIEAPRTLQTEPIHYAHHSDGYPLCWPQERDGEHEATREDGKVMCADCLAIIRSWDAEPVEVAAHAPRPEPVTAPLPTEAVAEARNALTRLSHEVIASTRRNGASTEEALADVEAIENALRLVPEDDEDAVRVPRSSLRWLRERNDVAKSKTNVDSNYVDSFLSMTEPSS